MAGEAIIDYSDMFNLATNAYAESLPFFKTPRIAGVAAAALVAGRYTSLWQYDGMPGGAGSTAPGTTAVVCTNATDGALKQATPQTGAKKRLVSLTISSLAVLTYVLADRLVHNGGLSGTNTSFTISSPTLTRYTSGVGVEAAVEVYTQVGATGTTIKLGSYTDDAGNTAQVGPLVTWGGTGFREAQRLLPLPVTNGDRGMRAISTVTGTATTGTAGSFGITMFKRVVTLEVGVIGPASPFNANLRAGGPIDLGTNSDACLFGMVYPNTTTVPEIYGHAFLIEK